MAKHLDKFTKPFQGSRIPFLLAEVITNGAGEMVDMVFRELNAPAAALLNGSVESLRGQRFTRLFPAERLAQFTPLHAVAFSGSAASFPWTTPLGQELTVTCYQPVYGMAACILEPRHSDLRDSAEVLAERLPGAAAVLELSRKGVRCLSFNRRLCDLTLRSRRELLDLAAGDASALVEPQDWPGLLQELLDAARDNRDVDYAVRLRRKASPPLWVDLRAGIVSAQPGVTTFYAMLLDIDRQHRTLEQLQGSAARLESAQAQLRQLFRQLPGGGILLQPGEGDVLANPLYLSRDLARLLGCPDNLLPIQVTEELSRRMVPEDLAQLSAAAAQSRAAGSLPSLACRVRRQDGDMQWLAAEGSWLRQEGGDLLYLSFTDRTRERELETGFQAQSQLCDLLLDRSRTISLDYDPVSGAAHLERYDAAGRRASQDIPNYLEHLKTAGTIHPDDRRAIIASIRRASIRPVSETLEYRGSYDGQGWRWYRISWVSLFDTQGDVYRLVGKAEDVTQQKAAAERFRELAARYPKDARRSMVAARLDLTADRILDIRGQNRHLNRVVFGNTAEACLRHLRSAIPDEDQQEAFRQQFTPEALTDAFRQGSSHFGLEHRLALEGSAVLWVRSMLELAENPETRHLEAFFRVADVEKAHRQQSVLNTLARDYEFVLTVDAASGICRLYGDRPPLPDRTTYRALAASFIQPQAPSHQRTAIRKAARLETVLAALEREGDYCVALPGDSRGRAVRWRWLDRENGILLVTLQAEGGRP